MLVTTNDYLARRDASEMGSVYQFFGSNCRSALSEDPKEDLTTGKRKERSTPQTSSTQPIVYWALTISMTILLLLMKESSCLHLTMLSSMRSMIFYLDSAQTPLIIAGSPRVQSNYYGMIVTLGTTLVEGEDYIYKERKRPSLVNPKGGPRRLKLS